MSFGYVCEVKGCRRTPLPEEEYEPGRDPQRYCLDHPGMKIDQRVKLRDWQLGPR